MATDQDELLDYEIETEDADAAVEEDNAETADVDAAKKTSARPTQGQTMFFCQHPSNYFLFTVWIISI